MYTAGFDADNSLYEDIALQKGEYTSGYYSEIPKLNSKHNLDLTEDQMNNSTYDYAYQVSIKRSGLKPSLDKTVFVKITFEGI